MAIQQDNAHKTINPYTFIPLETRGPLFKSEADETNSHAFF